MNRAIGRPMVAIAAWSLAACLARPALAAAEDVGTATLSPRATEALRLIESEDPYQRQVGFLRLEALREPAAAEVIRPYVDHRDPHRRAASLRVLAAIEGAAAVPLLLERLGQDRHPDVRRAALLGLEPLQQVSPAIVPALIQALADRDPEVRMTAIDAVSRLDDPRARRAILERKRREQHRDVRRVLQGALSRLEAS